MTENWTQQANSVDLTENTSLEYTNDTKVYLWL